MGVVDRGVLGFALQKLMRLVPLILIHCLLTHVGKVKEGDRAFLPFLILFGMVNLLVKRVTMFLCRRAQTIWLPRIRNADV